MAVWEGEEKSSAAAGAENCALWVNKASRKLSEGLKLHHITMECLWQCFNWELLAFKMSHQKMCICTVCARHLDDVLHISLFIASTSLNLVYENKKMPGCSHLYGTEIRYLK